MQHTRTSRWLAIATGTLAVTGALYILLKDDVVAGRWSDNFVLIPIMVGIAIAAGHLVVSALRERKFLAALGFALAFVMGVILTVYTSVSKQATTLDASASAVAVSTKSRDDKIEDIDRAKRRLAWYNQRVDAEAAKGGCGRVCRDWKARAHEVEVYITTTERQLDEIVPPKPVDAGAARVATILNILAGVDRAWLKALLVLLQPFAFALLFELTAIAAFGFAFGHVRNTSRTRSKVPSVPVPPEPGDEVIDWVREFRARNGRTPQIPEVQQRFRGIPKTTAWRRIKAA